MKKLIKWTFAGMALMLTGMNVLAQPRHTFCNPLDVVVGNERAIRGVIIVSFSSRSAAHSCIVPEFRINTLAVIKVLDMIDGQVVIGQLACAVINDGGIWGLCLDGLKD